MTIALKTYANQIQAIQPTLPFGPYEDGECYVSCNELSQEATFRKMETLPKTGNGFIGVSGFFPLELALRRGYEYVLLVDCSKRVALFWKNFFSIVEGSSCQEECLEKVQADLEKHIEEYLDLTMPSSSASLPFQIKRDFKKIKAVFSTLKNAYGTIKAMLEEGRLAFLQLNLIDTDACKKIQRLHKKLQITIDAIYLSNIFHFIPLRWLSHYAASLLSLVSQKTILIDTHDRPFKITRTLSIILTEGGHQLEHLQNLPATYQKEDQSTTLSTQRVRVIGEESIADLYPLVILKHFFGNEAYYYYGIANGFFKAQEMEAIEREATKRVCKSDPRPTDGIKLLHNLEKTTIDLLYPNAL